MPGWPYDDVIVPNMFEKSCNQEFANGHVPVVVGHVLNELDSLKFQFGDLEKRLRRDLPKGFNRLLKPEHPDTAPCMAERLMAVQDAESSMEDAAFNLGTYMLTTKSNPRAGKRWHFTITAPGAAVYRTWHTTPEILVWNISQTPTSPLYHTVTKIFVTDNIKPQLADYVTNNFQHFVKTGKVLDKDWPETAPVAPGDLGGLPSVDLDNNEPVATVINKHHNHHQVVKAQHMMNCRNKIPEPDGDLDLKVCVTNPQKDGGLTFDQKAKYAKYKSDLLAADLRTMATFTSGGPLIGARALARDAHRAR